LSAPFRRRSVLGWGIGVLLLAGLVAAIHYSVGWGTLLAPWGEIRPGALSIGVGLVLGSYAVRGIRIHRYFQPHTRGRFSSTFRLVLLHNLLNNLLPMRSGEASFPILMSKQFDVPYSRSIPALLYLRVLDLHFVVLVGLTVFLTGRGPLGWILLSLMVPLPYGIFRAQATLGRVLGKGAGRWRSMGLEALRGLPSNPGLFWQIWLWTVVNWSVKLLVLAWILRAFYPMPFPSALVGTATGELSSVLPLHGIAGAGSYEAGVMAGLLPLGIDLDGAIQAAVNLHLFLLGISILAGSAGALIPARKPEAGERAGQT